jgi:hypothetical protein
MCWTDLYANLNVPCDLVFLSPLFSALSVNKYHTTKRRSSFSDTVHYLLQAYCIKTPVVSTYEAGATLVSLKTSCVIAAGV